ncbi:odorant receptor 131-2-like [Erpetoichthys calabaricus]|uniref:odorant receptor 131-2-like n=1 Tax=Erpetoichthys calabaricus TaxID=27687 RepID=UPI002234BECF|nr:odorant receptor 131-2-like [Erpetoichthys calabaricus]
MVKADEEPFWGHDSHQEELLSSSSGGSTYVNSTVRKAPPGVILFKLLQAVLNLWLPVHGEEDRVTIFTMNSTENALLATFSKEEFPSAVLFSLKTKSIVKISIVTFLYIVIMHTNGLLIFTFLKQPLFHDSSRYVLYIHMVFNDVFELSVAVIMHIYLQVMPYTPVPVCYFLLILSVSSSYNTPLNLGLMALERYVAICRPFQHAEICTIPRTSCALAVLWVISLLPATSDLISVFFVEPLSFFNTRVICNGDSFTRAPFLLIKRHCTNIIFFSLVWFTIFFTYAGIFTAARSASIADKSSAKKAYNTVLLHAVQLILGMLIFLGPLTEIFYAELPIESKMDVQYTRLVFINIFPRVLSPLIYGLRDENFRKHIKGHLKCFCKMVHSDKDMKKESVAF